MTHNNAKYSGAQARIYSNGRSGAQARSIQYEIRHTGKIAVKGTGTQAGSKGKRIIYTINQQRSNKNIQNNIVLVN
jgi:hypothetical protein